jgi:hypothetical protein
MSEMKPYIGPHPTDHTLTEYYLKSEADEVIAHQKYRRCLAMARWCEAMRWHYLSYEEPKWFWWRKWQELWQELAEKFKPNN